MTIFWFLASVWVFLIPIKVRIMQIVLQFDLSDDLLILTNFQKHFIYLALLIDEILIN